jgi:hypothetical protein
MKCVYCHEEIGTVKPIKNGIMMNMHFTSNGQLEKCYTKRKFPFKLIFGERKYKGIKAELKCHLENGEFSGFKPI